MVEEGVIGVEQFNQMVKWMIETQPMLQSLRISGEISEIKYYLSSGHLYFTLKERESSVSCAAFRFLYKGIPKDLKIGDRIEVVASANFFEKTGRFQLSVERVKKEEDLGTKFLLLEAVKKRLHVAGYFDESRKKLLPKVPKSIGIITSEYGAALQDFINTVQKRNPHIELKLYPVHVQGSEVEEDVVQALDYFYKHVVDIIVITRGGGSIEDLWGFNSEVIALKMVESSIPIVSAIGHEVDTVLIDYVADVRASTPTQAAEIIIPVYDQLIQEVASSKQLLKTVVEKKITQAQLQLTHLKNSYLLKRFREHYFESAQERVELLFKKLYETMNQRLEKERSRVKQQESLLQVLSVERVLKRGFTLTLSEGKVVTKELLREGMSLETRGDGYTIKSSVLEIK